jgi:hypothetical protein
MKRLLIVGVLTGLVSIILLASCSHPHPVNLGDSVAFIGGNITFINNTSTDWTNVQLLLNESYTYSLSRVESQQTVSIPANEFVQNGEPFDMSTERPWTIKILCNLANGEPGEFIGSWH